VKKKFYFLTLHGERDIEDMETEGLGAIKLALEDSNYEVHSLNLLKETAVPADAKALVIVGLRQDLIDSEIDSIRTYLQNEGNLMVFIDPEMAPKFCQFLKEYGIDASPGMIIDPKGFKNYLNPIIEDYQEHEITKEFNFGTVFQLARSISPIDPMPDGVMVKSIAKTSPESWLETNTKNLDKEEPVFDETQDKKGPLSIVVVAEIGTGSDPETSLPETETHDDAATQADAKKSAKILVFGDSDFIDNIFVSTFPTNAALVLNSFHWIAEEKDLIAIPPKDTKSQPLHLTPSEAAFTFWIPVVLIPLIILVFGGIRIYERRRNG
jgi:ABC-type uncharacterized transport system involved in gliding motility auxiliary subunit